METPASNAQKGSTSTSSSATLVPLFAPAQLSSTTAKHVPVWHMGTQPTTNYRSSTMTLAFLGASSVALICRGVWNAVMRVLVISAQLVATSSLMPVSRSARLRLVRPTVIFAKIRPTARDAMMGSTWTPLHNSAVPAGAN